MLQHEPAVTRQQTFRTAVLTTIQHVQGVRQKLQQWLVLLHIGLLIQSGSMLANRLLNQTDTADAHSDDFRYHTLTPILDRQAAQTICKAAYQGPRAGLPVTTFTTNCCGAYVGEDGLRLPGFSFREGLRSI